MGIQWIKLKDLSIPKPLPSDWVVSTGPRAGREKVKRRQTGTHYPFLRKPSWKELHWCVSNWRSISAAVWEGWTPSSITSGCLGETSSRNQVHLLPLGCTVCSVWWSLLGDGVQTGVPMYMCTRVCVFIYVYDSVYKTSTILLCWILSF